MKQERFLLENRFCHIEHSWAKQTCSEMKRIEMLCTLALTGKKKYQNYAAGFDINIISYVF